MNFNNVLKSKYLYYAAVALMAINVLGYVSLGSIECVLVLGGAAYLANQFTKNRTVDIFIGLFVSNILFGCGRLKEGFEGLENKLDTIAADQAHKAKCAAADCKEGGSLYGTAACDSTGECKIIEADGEMANAAVIAGAAKTVKTNNAKKKKDKEKATVKSAIFN